MCILTETLIIRLHLWHFVLAYTVPNHSDVSHVFRPLKQCAWVASRDARELRAELHCLVDRSLSPLCVAAVVGLEIKTCVSSLERKYTATEEPAWMNCHKYRTDTQSDGCCVRETRDKITFLQAHTLR